MSKKRLDNRLSALFTSLEAPAEPSTTGVVEPPPADSLPGWLWALDGDYRYISCSPEVKLALGIDPQLFIHQSILDFHLDGHSSSRVKEAFTSGNLPVEVDITIQDHDLRWRPGKLCIIAGPETEFQAGWRGFVQLDNSGDQATLIEAVSSVSQSTRSTDERNPLVFDDKQHPQVHQVDPGKVEVSSARPLMSVLASEKGVSPAHNPRTKAGLFSLKDRQVKVISGLEDHPSTIAVPIQTTDVGDLLIEVVDENINRTWSEEEQQMVVQVASQLSLALENAHLYQAAQQELSERMRAEQMILHRNQDLATLNRLGQRLTSLTSRNEIFDMLAEMVGQVLDTRNLYVCMFDRNREKASYPIYIQNGLPKNKADRPAGNDLPEYLVTSRQPLLLTRDVKARFSELHIKCSGEIPASVLGIPFLIGSHQTGALVVQDFEREDAPQFDEVHLELLSTAIAQAATALENANLFQQMQEALKAIENRERYQAGVARAAASLSEFGTQALGEVLRYLGQASQANRVYLLGYEEVVQEWRLLEDWTSPLVAYLFDRSKIHCVPHAVFGPLIPNLRTDGWVLPMSLENAEQATAFFRSQNIQSVLMLGVSGESSVPSILVIEQIDHPRQWHLDEVNLLRVAADAIANTYIREKLLTQLRDNLDETESLYNASNRLVISNDYQEMLAAAINGVKPADINRGILLLFDQDTYGKLSRIQVQANWYSGHGTPPPPVGTEFPRAIYEVQLQNITQSFFEDIAGSLLDEAVRRDLQNQNVSSLAILPMWSGKRQIGVLLLASERHHTFTSREKRILPPLVDQLTIAVENLRLFEQTQTALAETALLYNITSGIAQAREPDEMVALVVNNVLPRGADRCWMMITSQRDDGEVTEIEVAGYLDTTGETNLKGTRLEVNELPLVRILPEEGITISDVSDPLVDPGTKATLDRLRVRSACFVPLRTGGRSIGAMIASSQKSQDFDPADFRLFRTVANGIAVAIEKQRLLRHTERRALELQTASEIARDTTSTLAQDVLLSRMVKSLVDRFGFYHAAIYLVDARNQFASVRESSRQSGQEDARLNHRVAIGSRSVIGKVTAGGEPVVLNDVAGSDLYYPNPDLPNTRAEIGLPLKVGNRIIGALDIHASTTNAFSKDDLFVLGILADQIAISIENARAYELSQKAIEDMREVDRVKSQFLANMSHELRTPLNSIIGFSRVILKGIDGPINDLQTQDLTAIYNSGQHLLLLINDILDLSKIDAGKMELSFSDLNINDMVNSSMSTATGLVKDKDIKLHTILPDDLPLVKADSIRVRQVLINFLSNAAKFTEQGTITVEAGQVVSPQGKPEVMITVTDTGPGIAPEDQSKLFLPFSQVDDSPTRKTGGTGLGLSICRSLIELHGGRIGLLSSEVGKGSTFYFTLPLPAQEVSPVDWTSAEGNVVLAIDDDAQVISLYDRYLRPQGFQVVPHTDPRTAVERAKEIRPFAITLDIMMPEMDGWQVMKSLKSDPATREIPIVVCSILEEQEKGFNLGAADYLVKPFLSEDLLNALNRLDMEGEISEILVIDDDPEDLRLVQKMIEEKKQFHAILAQGGKDGWDKIQQKAPHAIILDLFMPEMNGFEFLASLRATDGLKDIPVIVLTGADLTAEQHQQLTDFGQGLLSKGFLREKELLNSLEVALKQIKTPSER